ncbi:MAG: hypothetical protein Q9170_008184, partial [Blastenia crenularia]
SRVSSLKPHQILTVDVWSSIICIPAIGADPRATWSTETPNNQNVLWKLQDALPQAEVLLYDHLLPDERSLEVLAREDPGHQSTARVFAAVERAVARLDIKAWTGRLKKTLLQLWRQRLPEKRQAVPHHGSSVLSGPEYVQPIRDHLRLKWEMAAQLRQCFSLASEELKTLNYTFAKAAIGIRIYTYVESRDTTLEVLSSSDGSGEELTPLPLSIVDARSTVLNTADLPIDEEDIVYLNATHTEAPFTTEESGSHDALISSIMNGLHVDIHQFYQVGEGGASSSIKIWSTQPSLRKFFECGPQDILKKGVPKPDAIENALSVHESRPKLQISPASDRVAPTITLDPYLIDNIIEKRTTLNPSEPAQVKNLLRDPPLLKSYETVTNATLLPPADVHTSENQPPQRPHTYQLPNTSSDRFRWVHMPCNHAGWVPHVLTTISQENANLRLHEKLLLDQLWPSRHNRSRHTSPHARFIRPSVKLLHPEAMIYALKTRVSENSSLSTQATTSPSSATGGLQLVLYMPYLHWDSFECLRSRAKLIKQRMQQPNAHPVHPGIVAGKSMEKKLMWQYLTSQPPLHCRRTLDQYGYPSLRNTAVRDGDQVLYKRTKGDQDMDPLPLPQPKYIPLAGHASSGDDPLLYKPFDSEAKVLMVDQLWLWIVDERTVITFATLRERDGDSGLWEQSDLKDSIYKDVNSDYAHQCSDPFDFAALAVLTEQQTRSFKEFRRSHRFRDLRDPNAQPLPEYFDNRADLDALLELRDIEDELNTISKLLNDQHGVVNEMTTNLMRRSSGMGLKFLDDANHRIKEYRAQVEGMLNSARAAQTAFKELLDMKQKQANIFEAHSARKQTEVAADQSRSVMIFTVFTIIFLPLSFFASVFGINAREWSGTPSNLRLHTIFVYVGSISIAVILVALLVAFNRFTRRMTQKIWQKLAGPIQRVWSKVRGRRMTREGDHEEAKARLVEAASRSRRLSTMAGPGAPKRQWTKMVWDEEAGTKVFG